MTTIDPAKPAATPLKAADAKPSMITLDQLARELGLPPREARMMLRLAAKQVKQYPHLGREHEPRQPWQWMSGSKALAEARQALTAGVQAQ